MDFESSLRRAIKTGNVLNGQKAAKAQIQDGNAKMVVVANNCPDEFIEYLHGQENVFAYTYEGSSVQLGKACGKPFMVSALAIVDSVESDILNLMRT